MWLPTSIYERIPQFYALAGLLLITDGLYLGFKFSFTFSYMYFIVGFASICHGINLLVKRIRYRRKHGTGPMAEAAES